VVDATRDPVVVTLANETATGVYAEASPNIECVACCTVAKIQVEIADKHNRLFG